MIDIIDVRTSPATIKVLGVGGGGSNAVGRMIQAGLAGVEFWVANTDLQALENSPCPNRIQFGRAVTRGLGAGGDPEIGRLSAEEDREAIAEVLKGADMLFVTAGMGGGTGTGGAPVVASVARELGILTVAIVSKPFLFEGRKKMARAAVGLDLLGANVDTLIAIPNQKLLNIVQPGTPFSAAMLVADEVLLQATRGISDLITGHGVINLDFADVKTVMQNRGNALLGCGVGSGQNRALEAAQGAVSSPLLEEVSIFGAEALLINVHGGPDMGLHEAAEATQFISDRVGEEADVFWGAVVDPSLGDEMRVTIIATGFAREAQQPTRSREEIRSAAQTAPPSSSSIYPSPSLPAPPYPSPPRVAEPVGPALFAGNPVAGSAASASAAAPLTAPVPVSASDALAGSPAATVARPATESSPSPWSPAGSEAERPAVIVHPERSIWEVDPVTLDAEMFITPRETPASTESSDSRPPRTYDDRLGWGQARGRVADSSETVGDDGRGGGRSDEKGATAGWAGGPGADWAHRVDREWNGDRVVALPRRESSLDGRLGRNPLDRPAFMRKRMD